MYRILFLGSFGYLSDLLVGVLDVVVVEELVDEIIILVA